MSTRHGLTLIVGAGPTGLTAACGLLSAGSPVRIVDASPNPTAASKALLLWPRTLDILDTLGVRTVATETVMLERFCYYSRTKPIADVGFTDDTAPMCVLQSATERYLRTRLEELDGRIEWNTRIDTLTQSPTGVTANLISPRGADRQEVDWLIAADGAHSAVRKVSGIPFTGTTYESQFALIDAPLHGSDLPPNAALYFQSPHGALVIVALPGGMHRVFGSVPRTETTDAPSLQQMQELLDDRGPGDLRIGEPVWAATFNVHARAARNYRDRRVFLAGDAAHIHSPAGGQGLNAGIQDAHNLAWKLAAVNRGADPLLLDSYEQERQAITQRIVRDADLQTRGWLLTDPWKIAARDTAARIADRTGILNKKYAPLLAGRSHRYTASTALSHLRHPLVGTTITTQLLRDHCIPAHGWRMVSSDQVGTVHSDKPDTQTSTALLAELGRDADFVLIRPDNVIAAAGAGRHRPHAEKWLENRGIDLIPSNAEPPQTVS